MRLITDVVVASKNLLIILKKYEIVCGCIKFWKLSTSKKKIFYLFMKLKVFYNGQLVIYNDLGKPVNY